MKKLLSLFFILTLMGCSDSENESSMPIPAELIGKWKYVEYVTDYVEFDDNGNQIHYYIDDGFVIEFKDDGTFVSNEIEGLSNGTYTVKDEFMTLKYRSGINISKYYRSFYFHGGEELFVSGPFGGPMNETTVVLDGYILSKIP